MVGKIVSKMKPDDNVFPGIIWQTQVAGRYRCRQPYPCWKDTKFPFKESSLWRTYSVLFGHDKVSPSKCTLSWSDTRRAGGQVQSISISNSFSPLTRPTATQKCFTVVWLEAHVPGLPFKIASAEYSETCVTTTTTNPLPSSPSTLIPPHPKHTSLRAKLKGNRLTTIF